MGTGKVALTSENGEIKRNVSFGKSKTELTFFLLYLRKRLTEKKEYKKIKKRVTANGVDSNEGEVI